MVANNNVDAKELLKLELLSSLEKFQRAMFKAQYNRSFVVSRHHKLIFEALQDVVDGKCTRLIINMPPRYGKTETVVKGFMGWGFALNPTCRFLHLSYSDMLVKDNSDTVKQIMTLPLYTALFPESALEKEKGGSSDRWKTKAGGELYAVSTQGQVTGFGAGKVDEVDEDESELMLVSDEQLNKLLGLIGAKQNVFQGAIIIDDPIKPEDALSDTIRERINQRFENTIRNRVNSRNTPIIIIMQRLHEHDLCGYLMEKEPDKWRVLSLPAIQVDEDGNESALWPLKHTLEELHELRLLDPLVFDTQYMQDPTPKEGLMYAEGFGTYTKDMLPKANSSKAVMCNYTDTADTGADNLCSICFIDTPEYAYITDVLFTDKPMEHTEPATAKMLTLNKVRKALIESNNGGRGFARNVQRLLKTDYHNFSTRVDWFSQSKNKYVRIFSYSAIAQNTILFPEGWERKWPKFHSALMSYRKDNRRRTQHDDAPDCLTGVCEMREKNTKKTKIHRRN